MKTNERTFRTASKVDRKKLSLTHEGRRISEVELRGWITEDFRYGSGSAETSASL